MGDRVASHPDSYPYRDKERGFPATQLKKWLQLCLLAFQEFNSRLIVYPGKR